ncbi:LCP family protein [Actinoplanes flavus]|uniref:LCP family protein n=1 Tax=Actinoplanes flavus TaxID=2820290 RepID=UPI0027DCA070|nr:LCP family protein [Actinoplanes flavus]
MGALLLIPAGGAVAASGLRKEPIPGAVSPAVVRPAGERGALNFLLVGIDPRGSHTKPLADTIVVAHVPSGWKDVYLFSLPRDLVVRIPAFKPSGTAAERAKINAAMALGSRRPNGVYSPRQGVYLLARAVGNVTGIRWFDAAAIVNFGGFKKVVDTMGGVRVPVDQAVVSEHLKPNGRPRDRTADCAKTNTCLRPYVGPQKSYPRSTAPVRFQGWEALDYVRQRYGLPRSDYDRTRHQRQFLKAMAKRAMKRDVTAIVRSAGDSLTVVDGGVRLADWLTVARNLDVRGMTSIDLPGKPLFEGGVYRGEKFPPGVRGFFAAVAEDRVAAFLVDHPKVVTIDR